MCENCNINRLVIVNVSNSRLPSLTNTLIERKFYFTRIDDGGMFIQGTINTLIIGISEQRRDELNTILKQICSRRISHIPTSTQIETVGLISQPLIIEAETGGATIHTLPIEHFEQF